MLIFEGHRYAVRKVFHGAAPVSPGSVPVVVTFPHAGGPSMNRGTAFGQKFLDANGIDAYHVLNAQVDWFQHPEFWDAIKAIHMDAPPGREIVAYGASMGGYGALLASSRLAAARVLAVVPQYSIDRSVTPFEKRWKEHANRIGPFVHDIDAEIDADSRIYTLHDPRNIDHRQMDLFSKTDNWTTITLPFGGHTPLMGLQQANVLSGFVTDILYGRFDYRSWQPKLLRARRDSAAYWRVLAMHAVRLKRIAFAEYAVSRMRDLGAHQKEIDVTRAAIDRNIQSAAQRAARRAAIEEQRARRLEQRRLVQRDRFRPLKVAEQ